MATYQSRSTTISSERVLATTLDNYAKMLSEEATRISPLLAKLKDRGGIKKGMSGGAIIWPVKFDERPLTGFVDMQDLTINRSQNLANVKLEWGGYLLTDARSFKEKKINRGEAATVKFLERLDEDMRKDATARLAREVFKRRADTDGGVGWDGVEQMMSTGTQTAAIHQFATVLDSVYAGQSTVYAGLRPGAAGTPVDLSSIVGADPGYDAWSPKIVNATATVGGSALTWTADCDRLIRKGIMATAMDAEDRVDLVVCAPQSFYDLANLLDQSGRRLLVPEYEATKFGFAKSSLWLDGAMVFPDPAFDTTDSDSKTVHCYGLNSVTWDLHCLTDDIWEMVNQSEIDNLVDKFALVHLGNLKCKSPRRQFAVKELG